MDCNKYRIYIGVVGQIASGKGKLVECLVKEHGFISFSLSTIVHNELKTRLARRPLARLITREDLQDMGDELRKKFGRDVLARRAIIATNKKGTQKVVIEGIRNPAEIEYLKKLPNFTLIGVKAKRQLRYERLMQRKKTWDPKNWPNFLIVDRRDLGIDQKASGQQVGKCLAYADYTITNNGSIKELNKKVVKLTKKILKIHS